MIVKADGFLFFILIAVTGRYLFTPSMNVRVYHHDQHRIEKSLFVPPSFFER